MDFLDYWARRTPGQHHAIDARATPAERLRGDEWMVVTGHGGFAMGSPAGVHHRQYHSLLNAPTRPPGGGRINCVHSMEETLVVSDRRVPLYAHLFADGSVGPRDNGVLVRFEKVRWEATWVFEALGVRVTKRVTCAHRVNAGATRYEVEAPDGCTLEVRPRTPVRDMHHVLESSEDDRYTIDAEDQTVRVTAEGHTVVLASDAMRFTPDPSWTAELTYPTALARTDAVTYGERVWGPGVFALECGPGRTDTEITYALSPQEPVFGLHDNGERAAYYAEIRTRLGGAQDDGRIAMAFGGLAEAADEFLVPRTVGGRDLMTVIAGYPWFGDWGRDTMIALPGLMIVTGRYDDARACLETFAAHESEGMIPNLFDDDDTPAYNTVDASLWFLHALCALADATGERFDADATLMRAATNIIEGYRTGTRYGIGVDGDGLVYAGDAETQLTWMDAKREGVAFSPRYGKCVEINALWVHGLRGVATLLEGQDDARAHEFRALADSTAVAFNALFVRPDWLGLYDCLRPDGEGWIGVDEIRPNQLFAVSLERTPLAREHWKGVVDVCREHLLTPAGMRTLSPTDPGYRGRFKGDMMRRDAAYHNGTVWPWPIGAYCEAVLRAGGFSDAARAEAGDALMTLIEHTGSGCLGQISEVYDGDEPRDQEGCCAQAWSVAEVLRGAALVSRE